MGNIRLKTFKETKNRPPACETSQPPGLHSTHAITRSLGLNLCLQEMSMTPAKCSFPVVIWWRYPPALAACPRPRLFSISSLEMWGSFSPLFQGLVAAQCHISGLFLSWCLCGIHGELLSHVSGYWDEGRACAWLVAPGGEEGMPTTQNSPYCLRKAVFACDGTASPTQVPLTLLENSNSPSDRAQGRKQKLYRVGICLLQSVGAFILGRFVSPLLSFLWIVVNISSIFFSPDPNNEPQNLCNQ